MVYAQTRIQPGKVNTQNSLGFLDTNRLANLGHRNRPKKKRKKKENLPTSGLCRSGAPRSENQRKRKGRQNLILPEN